jgi:hypothetical protein
MKWARSAICQQLKQKYYCFFKYPFSISTLRTNEVYNKVSKSKYVTIPE